jgi:transcriptional regulator with XRE-family HTH domain
MTQRRLGAVVRRWRKRRNLTQGELARRAGLGQAHLSLIESGARANPTAAVLKKLARALDVSVTELLE